MKRTILISLIMASVVVLISSCATIDSGYAASSEKTVEQKTIYFVDLDCNLPAGYTDIIGSSLYFVGSSQDMGSLNLTKVSAREDCSRIVAAYIKTKMASYDQQASGSGGLGNGNSGISMSIFQNMAEAIAREASGTGKLLFPAGYLIYKDGEMLMGGKVLLSSLEEIVKSKKDEIVDELSQGYEVSKEEAAEFYEKLEPFFN